MSVTATPTLNVAGLDIPTAAAGSLVGVGELRLTWGRDGLLARTTPATAQVTVRDTSPGATFARRTDLIGQPVVLGWTATDGSSSSSGINFRGRITDAATIYNRDRNRFETTLACSSKEVELANYLPRGGPNPPTLATVNTRRAQLAGLWPAGLFAGGIPRLPSRVDVGLSNTAPDFPDYQIAYFDQSGTDALALLRQLYESLYPVTMVYDPAGDRITWVPRRVFRYSTDNPAQALSGMLVSLPQLAGRYAPRPLTDTGLPIDAADLAYPTDGELVQPLDSRLTRIEVVYLDSANGYATAAATATTPDTAAEDVIGRRTLSLDTILSTAAQAADLAAWWAELAAMEARAPRLGPVLYSTRRSGGFESLEHAATLLAGAESAAVLFVRGTWLTRLGQRPQLGLIGGVLVYAGGQWALELTPAPVATVAPTQPLQIRYAAKPTVRLADIDPSVTIGDLGFVDVGAGFTSFTQPPWGAG